MRTRSSIFVVAVAAAALGVLGIGTAAAQIIGVPDTVEVGTAPSDHPNGIVAVANGGCAVGTVAIGIGGCAPSGLIAVGVGSAGARGDIVITTNGNAETPDCAFICVPPRVAVTGGGGHAGCSGVTMIGVNLGSDCAYGGTFAYSTGGAATGNTLTVTQSGTAGGGDVSIAVTGDAGPAWGGCYSTVSVSVTGDACADAVAVSGAGNAEADGVEIAVAKTITELLP